MSVIELHQLTKSYGKSRGIIDVSFTVEKEDIFGFIGPNGSGKSTTIRTLLALIHPTSGSATILGQDCIREAAQIARHVGYLPAEVHYYSRMRVLDLLQYAASFYSKDCTARVFELAERMELDLKPRIESLSFGNKKKVGIVQALLHEPQLLILDEPTNGLDPLMQQRFFDILREEQQKGTTIFFSSHILSEVQRLCNRVAIIREGRIVKVAEIEKLTEQHSKKCAITLREGMAPHVMQVPGIRQLVITGDTATFLFQGEIRQLIQHIAQLDVVNISIEDLNLEEIFMHFYEKEA